MLAVAHSHIELVPSSYFAPAGTSYHGHEGVRSITSHTWANFPAAHAELREAEALGEWLRADVRLTYKADEVRDVSFLFRFEDGQIRRIHAFRNAEEAAQAACGSADVEFRALFDGDPGPIALIDDGERLADVNPAACEFLGVSRDDLRGRPITDFVSAEGLNEWRRAWDAMLTHGYASGKVTVIPRNGQPQAVTFWASAHYSPGRELGLVRAMLPSSDGRPRGSSLTPREREILQLLARGLNAPQVADELFISPLTVRTHVQNAMARLGARTRVQAIALALARGEIEP